MNRENPLWGAPRIHGELLKLGFQVAQSTVAKYMAKSGRGRSQTWKTFLSNHAPVSLRKIVFGSGIGKPMIASGTYLSRK
jgi:hypothetical protein